MGVFDGQWALFRSDNVTVDLRLDIPDPSGGFTGTADVHPLPWLPSFTASARVEMGQLTGLELDGSTLTGGGNPPLSVSVSGKVVVATFRLAFEGEEQEPLHFYRGVFPVTDSPLPVWTGWYVYEPKPHTQATWYAQRRDR